MLKGEFIVPSASTAWCLAGGPRRPLNGSVAVCDVTPLVLFALAAFMRATSRGAREWSAFVRRAEFSSVSRHGRRPHHAWVDWEYGSRIGLRLYEMGLYSAGWRVCYAQNPQ